MSLGISKDCFKVSVVSSLYSIFIVLQDLTFCHCPLFIFLTHSHTHALFSVIVLNECLPLQEHLELLARDNEQLKAEVKELLNSSALASTSRDQGEIRH